MAKAVLEFDLSDPDDAQEHGYAIHGRDAFLVLWGLDEELRKIIKYGEHPEEVIELAERIRNLLQDECESHNVSLMM